MYPFLFYRQGKNIRKNNEIAVVFKLLDRKARISYTSRMRVVALSLLFFIGFLSASPKNSAVLPKQGVSASLKKELRRICAEGLKNGVFSGAAIAAGKAGERPITVYCGETNEVPPRARISSKTLFDLASLTKPIVTLSLFLWMEKHGKLNKTWPLSRFFPTIRRSVSLEQLLTHHSGLPPYHLFYLMPPDSVKDRKKVVVDFVASLDKTCPPRYSDINYMLLGFVLETVGKAPLDKLFSRFLHEQFPEKMPNLLYTPLKHGYSAAEIAATYPSPIRKKMCQGVVEDENCAWLGGVSGHAGLFGSADAVFRFFSLVLTQQPYRSALVHHRGYDVKEGDDSQYGTLADTSCSGHLGWSGTAFLACPRKKVIVVILTNRTHSTKYAPAELEPIKQFRQQVFTAALSSF